MLPALPALAPPPHKSCKGLPPLLPLLPAGWEAPIQVQLGEIIEIFSHPKLFPPVRPPCLLLSPPAPRRCCNP